MRSACEIDLYLDLECVRFDRAVTTPPISCSIDGGKCNSGEESADCIRPLFDFTDEFTSFVLIKQIANYWNDSSLYLSFADRRFSDYLMITRQRVGSNIERQRE